MNQSVLVSPPVFPECELKPKLITFNKALKVFQELDVLLMLDGGAQLHELVGEGVVDPAVGQEVHQMVIQGLRNSTSEWVVLSTAVFIIAVSCLSAHPVQRVCVERVARLLPVWISLWLETDFPNGKNVALFFSFSFTVTYLQNTNLSCLALQQI